MNRLALPVCMGLVLSTAALASHTLEETVLMVESGATEYICLKFKLKDSVEVDKGKIKKFESKQSTGPLASEVFEFTSLFAQAPGSLREIREERKRLRPEILPKLENYFIGMATRDLTKDEARAVLKELYEHEDIEFAYFQPIMTTAVLSDVPKSLQEAADPNEKIPDYEDQQRHLEDWPLGVGAKEAWKHEGCTGESVRIVDVESGWVFTHKEFREPFSRIGNPQPCDTRPGKRCGHGTAVWGVIAGKRDGSGITGIAHGAKYATAAVKKCKSSVLYREAASCLRPGDVLVIEQQLTGPVNRAPVPVEYWHDAYVALKSVTLRGVHVVEAAGNGRSNLDNPPHKPRFDRNERDSGAILVGAARVVSGKLMRHEESNHGARIDAYGYGESVVTAGYGDLWNWRGTLDADFTNSFSGTSSATAIVAGVVAVVEGRARYLGRTVSPQEMRAAISRTSKPEDGDGDAGIVNLPDIMEILKHLKLWTDSEEGGSSP